jgi:hypothetical protein
MERILTANQGYQDSELARVLQGVALHSEDALLLQEPDRKDDRIKAPGGQRQIKEQHVHWAASLHSPHFQNY